MKTILKFYAGLALAGSLHAAILTVDNNPGAVAQYNNFAAAYTAANDGDTILLSGSSVDYGSHTIHKRLNILGPGYFLENNNIPSLNTRDAIIRLSFVLGNPSLGQGDPSGSLIKGILISGAATSTINISSGMSNFLVVGCNGIIVSSSPTVIINHYGAVSLGQGSSGSIVKNSILSAFSLRSENSTATNCIFTSPLGVFAGNVNFIRLNSIPLTSISNSIFAGPTIQSTSDFESTIQGSVNNCMAISSAFLPSGSGNINGPLVMGNVFVNTGTDDARWQLKAGSAAIGAGLNGVDIGAFGGLTPYRLSGVPGIPRLTRLVVPATATNTSGLRFEVSAQAFGE